MTSPNLNPSYYEFINSLDEGFELLQVIFDEEGNAVDFVFLEVNPAYEKQCCVKAQDIIGKRKKEAAPASDPKWYDKAFEAIKTGKIVKEDYHNPKVKRDYETRFVPISKDRVAVLFRDITEQKQAEDMVKQTQSRLQDIIDQSPEVIEVYDKDGLQIQVNNAWDRLWEIPRDCTLRKYNILKSKQVIDDGWLPYLQRAYAGETVTFPELQYDASLEPQACGHGRKRWLSTIAYPVKDADDKVTNIVVLHEDITERKNAHMALVESEEKYKALVDGLPEMVLEVSVKGQVSFVNSRVSELLGYSKDELENDLDANAIIAAEDVERLRADMSKLFSDGLRQSGEYTVIRKNGTRFPVWLNSAAIIKDKQIVGARIIGFDLTERKRAEEALKNSELKFRTMADFTYDWEYWIAPDGKLLYVTPSCQRITGYMSSEFLSNPDLLKTIIHPDDAQDRKHIEEINSKGEYTKTFRIITRDGDVRWIEHVCLPVFNEEKFLGRRASNRDVTDRIVAEAERKVLEKQLQDSERLATIGQTAGMVGHDIRNPLQAMTSDVFLMKEEVANGCVCKNKEDILESLGSLDENINYVNKIVQDLQDYARPINPEYSIVDLSTVLVRIFETVRVPDSIKLSMKIKDLEKINTDPMLLQRALSNLVTNAIQAMQNGGTLEITCHPQEDKAVITVSDTGVGIPQEIKPKLFTPMMTTKSKGQGFGLAVTKRLIEAMNGRISFESELGKGTKFSVELPT